MASYDDDFSVLSDLSSLEGSDDFGRKLLQHTKDAQRMSNLRSQSQSQSQAFRKAKPLPRAALNLDNLERNDLRNPPAQSSYYNGPASANGSSASDPPLNLPREWGRKGRPNHAWMRQIHSEQQVVRDESLDLDWADVANEPQHVSPSQRHARVASTPPSVQQNNPYSEQWGSDGDFSAVSLLASTPALPSRSRLTIDQIRQREILTMESHLTASPRVQSQQTRYETTSRRKEDNIAESSRPATSLSPVIPTLANKENIPLEPRRSPRPLYRTSDVVNGANHTTPRPSQRRTDSMALLKRLSRTPSASPSPTSSNQGTAPANASTSWAQKHPKTSAQSLFQINSPQAPEVLKGPEPAYVSRGNSSQAPEVVEAPQMQQQQPRQQQYEEQQSQQQQQRQEQLSQTEPIMTPLRPAEPELPLKTPVVTGAWIDTPQTARPSSQRTFSEDDAKKHQTRSDSERANGPHQRAIPEPKLPMSALDAVLQDLRNGKRIGDEDQTLGDSTIASLEAVMNPDRDTTMRLNLPDVPAAQPQPTQAQNGKTPEAGSEQSKRDNNAVPSVDLVPTTQKQRDERQEWFALESLKSRLGGTSAKDQSTHESEMAKSLDKAIASATSRQPSSTTLHQHQENHTSEAHCMTCGHPPGILRAAWSEYWSLYFRWDARSSLGFRFTWLGLGCTLFWSWLITEFVLSSIFSPPRYATTMRGYGVDPHAPEFPYVLPTLILRPLSPVLTPLASMVTWLYTAVAGQKQYKYYAASPGAWGSAGRVKISPPGPRSAYSTRWTGDAADGVSWLTEESVGEAWNSEGKGNVWSGGRASWEAEQDDFDSMLVDEIL